MSSSNKIAFAGFVLIAMALLAAPHSISSYSPLVTGHPEQTDESQVPVADYLAEPKDFSGTREKERKEQITSTRAPIRLRREAWHSTHHGRDQGLIA